MSPEVGERFEDGRFPLSAAQMNIYLAQQLAPDVPFTIAQYVEIRGDIDPSVLIRATDIACRRLESPAVRIGVDDGHPYQWSDLRVPYAMIYRDFTDRDHPIEDAQRYMDEQYRQPVDLVRDQLIASEIIQVGACHYYWYSRAHHIVMDGLGAISVQERTAAVYTALISGTEIPKTRAIGVREIYDYEAAYPNSSRYETDRQYWLGRLDGHLEAPRLAGSPSEPAAPSGVTVSVGAVLDADLTEAVAAVAHRYNSSDVPVVLATFALYLARMTDTEDVMLSLPVSGRATTKLRESSGMMSNVVPLRIGVEPGVTVEELLRRIQVELTGALRHQRFRVEDMQRATGDGTGSAAAGRGVFGPTVNIMMYNSTIRLGDVIGEYRVLSSGPIDDMMVNVYPGVAGKSTRVDFLGNPALYTTDELAAHHRRFLALLREVVLAPEGLAVSELDVLDANEKAALLGTSATVTATPALLPSLLTAGAVVRATGVDQSSEDFTRVAEHIAAQLVSMGAGPEKRIAVAIERSYESVLASWAVSISGASFVPLDPNEPAERLAGVLADAHVEFGITTRAALEHLPDTIQWFDIEDLLDADPRAFTPPTLHVDNEAYVIHTSGSTGKPKAVSVTHRGLAQLAANVADRYAVTPDSRVLHVASPVFDASIQEILAAFAAGATLVIAPADVYAGPALAHVLDREKITHLITSPTVLATLDPDDLSSIDVFDVGGEQCPSALRDRFVAADAAMRNAYGPTEATVLATLSDPMRAAERVTIGAPLPGVRGLVLDAHLGPTPCGGVGELYLGGDGLARGYSGQAGVTSTRFVADPGVPGARLYRTGDIVRRSFDGSSLEYLGRSDQQIQLHGRRLELGEVEAAATTYAGVTAAVAVVRDNRLVLYVTGVSAGLDSHLRNRLPAWMIPNTVVVLDALPITASGKVDRRALPAPIALVTTEYVAPQTDTERTVAGAFAAVLGVEEVGRDHSFFELGGDSLSATRVLARLGSSISLTVLFADPTVRAVAAAIDSSATREVSLELLDTVLPERIPLSYAQQRLWFLNQFEPASPAYNMPVAVRARAGDDAPMVLTALRDVIERHEALRTYYPSDGDGPRQVVRPTDTVLVEVPERTVSERDLDSAVAAAAAEGFDVSAEVPIRATLLSVRESGDTVIVVVVHHISMDGWSVDPLVRDFAFAHASRRAGHAPTWPRLRAQYGQYAVWNRVMVDSVADEQLSFWTSVLGDTDTAAAELPADFPRAAVQSMVTDAVPFEIGSQLHAGIRELARSKNSTTFMIVHAAVAAALSRFGTSNRVVVGSPTAGRGHEALDEMVGMFVGTLPLAVTVDPSGSFASLLDAVRTADLDAFSHSDVPFERIVDALATDRSLDRHPLFQVMLAFDNAPHRSVEDLPVSVLEIPTRTSEFDLTLVLAEEHGDSAVLTGQIDYALDLYQRATVEQFASVILNILNAAVADPTVVIGDLALADTPTLPSSTADGTLLDVLGSAPEIVDNSVAIDGLESLTYAEFDRRSDRIARLLISHGVGPETLVALSLERSAEYIVALWGVVKAGGAFVPVDPRYPALRREQVLEHIEIGFGGIEPTVHWLDETQAQNFSDLPLTDADRLAALKPEHPAYVIHTSGSTGTPKPVVVTHQGVYALAEQVIPRYGVTSSSRVLHGYSVNFDAAVLELVLAFGAGATMVIAPPDLLGGDEMSAFLTAHRVTHYLSTPAVLATVPPAPGVETVAVGGDVLGTDVVDDWSAGRSMLNAYGPSEATVVATLAESLRAGEPVTIGRPLAHVGALVLDDRLHPVPLGGVGELYLAGSGVARGYHADPAATAARFVAAPGGARMYRTGDLVRQQLSGMLDYRGRRDDQVQINGVRIELGEIESALTAHPDVGGAVTALREKRIHAWVVGLDAQDAAQWLLDRLPLSMQPAVINRIDGIPLTGNGKVDLAALYSETLHSDTLHGGDSAAVRTLAQEVVLGIFADLLGIDNPAVDDNFFVLGGDSLVATRAATRISAALGTHVPVRTIFESPTAEQLASAIELLSENYTPLPALVHDPDARSYPGLAPAERRIWLQNRYDPVSAAYNIAFEVPLPADLNLDVLRAAIADVLERHTPLRTMYPSTADGPVTVVLDPHIVLSTLDDAHAGQRDSALHGFDLTLEAALRLGLVERGGERVLSVVAHHIAIDGLSLRPLARDVEIALLARMSGSTPEFGSLTVDYSDYRVWQRDVLDVVASDQLEFWRRTLAGVPEFLDLPTGTPDPSADATAVEFSVGPETLTRLRSLAHRLGATVFVVVHAALAAVLAEASGTQDIAVGTPVAGRSDPALDHLVGMFVGTVVLRTEVDPSTTFEDFVTVVRDRDLDAFANSDVPFEWVVDAVQPTRAIDTHPLFQVLLAFGDTATPTIELGTSAIAPRRVDITATQFDLEVLVDESEAGLIGHLGYSPARFSRSVILVLAERLTEVLTMVSTRPETRLGSAEFGHAPSAVASHRGSASERTLAAVFEQAVTSWPDDTAVIEGSRSLTYREVDQQSNALADRLVHAGARPGALVAIAYPRSVDYLVAIWAVAKTGAGFLSIDPSQPVARVQEILDRAAPVTGISAADFHSVGSDWVSVTGDELDRVDVVAAPLDSVAYVVYTSGSTGVPKGVRVTHRGIANLVESQRDLFGVEPGSRVLQFASPSFDASIFETLMAVGAGAAVVIVPSEVHGGRELEALIDRHQVTHACLTPTVLQVTDADAVPSLRVVVMAGEAANSALLQRWSRQRSVFNAYGPTEGTVMSTCTTDQREWGSAKVPVTIGGPTLGFDTVVLDARLRPVGNNVVGELYLGGAGLAEGYVGQSGTTASSFVANPFGDGRLYRTGDLVRWVVRGSERELEYLGRVDSQVKVRGHRVELSEVEAALLRHRNVRQASVIGRAHSLAAYVVGGVEPREARDFLARTLPAYMVPSTVTVVDALPMTLSGKVDVSALPEPSVMSTERRAPVSANEVLVHAVFSDVLQVAGEDIGVDDNFFDLGGHSLSAVQVMDALGDRLGRRLPISLLLVHPTISALAMQLDAGEHGVDSAFDVVLPLRTEGVGAPLFCVHPAIGIAWSYFSLLGETDRPLYGLQVPGIADGEAPPTSIEEFAERYVREIRGVQAHGPYHLVGWSLGGVIAHAVATQLQSEGEEVALLALVDAQLSAPKFVAQGGATEFGIDDLARQLGVEGDSFETIVDRLRETRSELAFLTVDHLQRMYRPVAMAPTWVASYAPRVFTGPVHYFAASASHGAEHWTDLVDGGIAVHRVDAEHEDMLGELGARALGRVIGTDAVGKGVA
ncbi:non-ribosomal peptide synthetase [Rhodococcoides yunnanense]|uniref:Amino acid adenylation domain-containing protein n=1 Tax=Rhodococcoides yunnanense TaxID=278209 RepID=A0ABU4B798_9NOCA|nr:non-ribosomal peptide synthetase [Rhodococcus yunnanensis]MDV6260034.1 amino acid adenylation domain-containing protein [Rhodococcus yunnanensis]